MASHSLAIAKASLAAGLIRPDPTSISKSEIARFHTLLEAVLKQCSTANIQLGKEWLLKNIIPSAARTIAIGKYLVALSLSFAKTADEDDQKPARGTVPSGRRRQLHILYLLNDLLHHTRYHIESSSAYSMFTENVQSYLVDLFGAASTYSLEVYVKQHKAITDLLDTWEGKDYYQSSYIQRLRDTVANASKVGSANTDENTKFSEEALSEEKKDAPYILPPSHGDPLTAFYDLPAGNMMPQIMPNSARAINPQHMKALQFTSGPAGEHLVTAVKDFLKSVESLDAHGLEDQEGDMDIDGLGQSILGDEIAGNVVEGEGYYGWSRAFCEKMKKRGLRLEDVGKITGRAAPGSIDRSLSPRKRRRYSDSSSSKSRDTNMDKSRSSSLSSNQGARRRSGQRSSLRSKDLSREERRYHNLRSRSRSRSPSYSPPQTVSVFQRPPAPVNPHPRQQTQAQRPSPPPSMHFPHSFSKGFPLGPGGFPIPPPPPPNYHGPWPPPPPPMPNPDSGNVVPAPAPPTGPKIGQNHGAPAFPGVPHSGFPSQSPQNFGGWSQQQFGRVSGKPYGDRGGAPQAFNNGNVQNGRGRGLGRGGWTR